MDRREVLKSGSAALALIAAAPLRRAQAAPMDEFAALDGMGQAALVRNGEVQPIELVDAAIARIEKLNPVLNAVVHKSYDKAREVAKGALPDGPFRGVPYLIKDLSPVQGAPMTMGSRLFENYIAGDEENGSVIRAREAGLVFLGKTNTPEFGLISTTESILHGAARNPWNTAYHTGGSSGGAAAAAASGMVPFAHASDGGGSIRIPASVCGLVGLKPSRGRLFAGEPPMTEADIAVRMAVSRSVRDTAQILNVSEQKGFAPVGFVSEPASKRLKIAFCTKTYDGREPHPQVRAALEKTAALCADLGHEVERLEKPPVDEAFIAHFMNIWSQEAKNLVDNAWLIGLFQGRIVKAENVLEPFVFGLADYFENNLSKDPDIIKKALAYFKKLEGKYNVLFDKYDVELTPTLGQPPLLIGTQGSHQSFDALYESILNYVLYTAQYNATGHPAISLPVFASDDNMPIGSHFGARHGNEKMLLELAYELEAARGWTQKWPQISARYLP